MAPSLEVHTSLSVCGNIHDPSVFPFWRDVLCCLSWHLGILSQGLKLDFLGDVLPGSYYERNNRSARNNPSFVNDSLFSMASANVLEEVFEKPLCVNTSLWYRPTSFVLGWQSFHQSSPQAFGSQTSSLPHCCRSSLRRRLSSVFGYKEFLLSSHDFPCPSNLSRCSIGTSRWSNTVLPLQCSSFRSCPCRRHYDSDSQARHRLPHRSWYSAVELSRRLKSQR